MIAFHSEYPNTYEVVVDGARVGCVQRYGKREWVPYMAPGFRTMFREYTTRGEAGKAMAFAWKRGQTS